MPRKRPFKKRPTPTKSSGPGAKSRGIPRLALDTDLEVLFSGPTDPKSRQDFADALAEQEFSPARLEEILSEKEENAARARRARPRSKGTDAPQEVLDLHGCTAVEARAKTELFLSQARNLRLRTVLVITGKGLHSPEGPVLKDAIEAQLNGLKSENKILAYFWEKKDKEQSGGLIVSLP